MADLQYIKTNSLRDKAGKNRDSAREKGIIILLVSLGFFVVIGGLGLLEIGIIGLVLAGMVGLCVMFGTGTDTIIAEAGADGEEYALKTLSELDDSYTIFNQVRIPCKESKTGYREADFVVCGPNGIFVVEVKNNKGIIVGTEADPKWEVRKVGGGGTPYSDHMRNPIRQVRSHIFPLKEYFVSKGINDVWINGAVLFTNPESALKLHISGRVPVLRPTNIEDHITKHRQRCSFRHQHKVVSALTRLHVVEV
ncbi:MAG: nuclease-related domain-containing protein [Syntrophales bacterium]|nr:nuclease-related domain-containing protein [Syntrophales bacterium]